MSSFAVVTGAGRGIGRAVAARLAASGYAVVVSDIDQGTARQSADELVAQGAKAVAITADVREIKDIEKTIGAGEKTFDLKLGVFVNNAGFIDIQDPFHITGEQWDRLFEVNTRGTFFGTQVAGRIMREQKSGSIINIASAVARGPYPNAVHYAASKAAVINLTMSFARVLAPHGVRVNSIAPAIVDTDLWLGMDRQLTRRDGAEPGSAMQRRIAEIPLGRSATPADVADAVAFLASDQAAYITGECLHLTGGSLMI
jgi:meso-butanediol dehydrogenase/(S,S)-butanediol dehydrogenase/diacetyl reductase